MSGYETASLTEIEAVLDGLEEATSQEVYDATRGYSPKALASVAASRADAAGGGGGGGVRLLGPFSADHNSPNIGETGGALVATIDDGDLLLNCFVYITETWENDGGLYVLLGDPNGSQASLWVLSFTSPVQQPDSSNASYDSNPFPGASNGSTTSYLIGPGLTDGRVCVSCNNTVTAGAVDVYLLVATPADA